MGNKLDISGTGTNNLVFEYVLVADDKGDIPYYRDSASLVLSNNATITVSGTKTPANTTLPAPSSLVSSATQAAPTCSNNPCNTGSVVSITVDFTEAVIVNGVPHFDFIKWSNSNL